MHFYNFVLTSARKLSLSKQFTHIHLKVLITLLRMIWFGVWATVHEILANNISKKMLMLQKFKKKSSTSKTNISKIVSHSIINNIIFWKCLTRPFRCIYVTCFKRLRFLVEVSTKLQKMYFFRQFKDHNSEKWPNLFIYFFHFACIIYFWIWNYSKFIFDVVPHLIPSDL